MNNKYIYILIFFVLAFFVVSFVAWHLHRKLLMWKRVFTGLSNAERVILMWPLGKNNKPARQLTLAIDRSEDGFARLYQGSEILAKLPIDKAIAGQQVMKELVEST